MDTSSCVKVIEIVMLIDFWKELVIVDYSIASSNCLTTFRWFMRVYVARFHNFFCRQTDD